MRLLLIVMAVIATALASSTRTEAHEFPAPTVTVTASKLVAGGHPDVQTTITVPDGPGYDTVRIASPAGSGIAADADVPDGTVVGRLDATATTNAITRPDCDLTVAFSVDIVEATTDTAAASYPAYLRDVAPGQHRLRFVADVSPSADIPILINYLFDIDPATDAPSALIVVGDPTQRPEVFRSCTPQSSANTLFGTTLDGVPLLTSPDPLPASPLPFAFAFTSRPDADGHTHERAVSVTARTPEAPTVAPELRLVRLGSTGRVEWAYPGLAESFLVESVVTPNDGGESHSQSFIVSGGRRSFDIAPGLLSSCAPPDVYFRVAAVVGDEIGPFAETETIANCVEGPENPLPFAPPANLRLGPVQNENFAVLAWDDASGSDLFILIIEPEGTEASGENVAPRAGVPLPLTSLPDCERGFTYRVAVARNGIAASSFAELFVPRRNCTGVQPPDTGSGPSSGRSMSSMLVMLAAGLSMISAGVAARRRV